MSFVAQAQDRYLSPFNDDPEVRASLHLPQRVILNDLTLRERREDIVHDEFGCHVEESQCRANHRLRTDGLDRIDQRLN